MAIVAHLYRDARWATRHKVEIEATLRDPEWSPFDAVVEDLSSAGFRIDVVAELPLDAEIGLGIAGIGLRDARIVRRTESGYGCEFVQPLTVAELDRALRSRPAEPSALPFGAVATIVEERYPMGRRVAIIAAGALLSWGLLVVLLWGTITLVRALAG